MLGISRRRLIFLSGIAAGCFMTGVVALLSQHHTFFTTVMKQEGVTHMAAVAEALRSPTPNSDIEVHTEQSFSVAPRVMTADTTCSIKHGTDIDVSTFGAIPDDGGDDTTAIVNAFACALDNAAGSAHKKARVFFPAGEFRLTEKLTTDGVISADQLKGLSIMGAGIDETSILYQGTDGFLELEFNSNDYAARVSDITLVSTQENAGTAITIQGVDRGITAWPNFVARNVIIKGQQAGDYFTRGIYTFATKRNVYENIHIYGSSVNQSAMEVCFDKLEVYGADIFDSSCSYAQYGVIHDTDRLGGEPGPEGGTVANVRILDTDIGVYVRSYAQEPGLHIVSNYIRSRQHNLQIDGRQQMEIHSNTFDSSQNAGADFASIELNAAHTSQIDNNRFRNEGAATGPAITLNDMVTPMINGNTPVRPSTRILINENEFDGYAQQVVETGGATENVVRDNTII